MKAVPPYDERALLEAISQGDAGAFRQLFDAYKDKVFSYAMHFTHDSETARDLVQEIFLSVWTGGDSLVRIERFGDWLFMSTRNRCFNHLRKLAREEVRYGNFSQLPGSDQPTPEEYLLTKQYDRLHREAIDKLPEQQRRVYLLYTESPDIDALAQELKVAPATVRSHLALARRAVRAYIKASLDLALVLLWIHS